jgi:N-carbamoyl-D-amino-acid hydrolase
MPRHLTIAAAQLGPIARSESRRDAVARLIALLRQAHASGCELVVFPECALTAFFPHWWIDDPVELDRWFERAMPGPETQPLFDEAARLRIGFYLGYAELTEEEGQSRHYNACILVGPDGRIIGKYRKIHLPGHCDHRPQTPFQNLEKRCFDVGNLGFRAWSAFGGIVGMLICNDRRWPEAYRVLGLQGAELVLLGYNTPRNNPEYPELDRLSNFHNLLSMQAGAYQNGTWVVGAAKAGIEEGVDQIGQSAIIAPSGEVVAMTSSLGDELIVHRCDLDLTRPYKQGVFNFALHRRTEHYGPIVSQVGAEPPAC